MAKEWRCSCVECNRKEHRRKNIAADDVKECGSADHGDDNRMVASYIKPRVGYPILGRDRVPVISISRLVYDDELRSIHL